MSRVKSIRISQIYISSMDEQQFYHFFESETSSIVKSIKSSFISNRGIRPIIE